MNNIKDTADAVKGIVEAVPIYQDLLQPAAQEIGKSLQTVAKTVHIALAPISALVWGYEQISAYVQTSLVEKLKNVPQENIVSPDLSIAGPTLEAMRYNAHREELRDMFINLLATSMDSGTTQNAHPSFVEVIKQINSDEAKIINLIDGKSPIAIIKIRLYDKDSSGINFAEPLINFSHLPFEASCAYPNLGPSYLENIKRLGLVDITYSSYNTNPNAYEIPENHSVINDWRKYIEGLDKRLKIERGAMTRTAYGKKFFDSCVISK